MTTKSKILLFAALAATSIASPAFAQSFDPDFGTGNSLPAYYGQSGALHEGRIGAHQGRIAVRRSGLGAFAMVPSVGANSAAPSLEGGGSVGYNENLKTDQW